MKTIKDLDTKKNGYPCIYKIQNKINHKVYIGSAIGHYKRKGQHFYLLRNNNHFNKHLQSSWNKYGEKNFEFEVIEFIKDLKKLKSKEEYYIRKYNSNKKGFNFRIYCDTNLGTKRSLESRLKQSKSKKGKTPNINYTLIAKKNMKKITGIHIKTGKEIICNSVKEAGKLLGIYPTNVSKALHKKIKSAGGFYWNFTEESVSNNSVNSGKLLKDNPEPSSLNGIKVNEKVQRLIDEEPTNKSNTSPEQPERLKI